METTTRKVWVVQHGFTERGERVFEGESSFDHEEDARAFKRYAEEGRGNWAEIHVRPA